MSRKGTKLVGSDTCDLRRSSRANPIPYVVAMLSFAVVWVTVTMIRNNRRLDALVQLISQNDTHGGAD